MADYLTRLVERLTNAVFGIAINPLLLLLTDVSFCVHNALCLRILLNFIPNIDYIDDDPFRYHTMLTKAAEEGKLNCVRLLLDRGANVNARNGNGETALMYACNEKVFDLLIKRGADIHVKGINGTAVGMAGRKNVRCLHKLVSLGASIYEENCCGQNTFMMACLCGNEDVVNAVLPYMEYHSERNNSVKEENSIAINDIDIRDNKGKTALMLSCEEGHVEPLKILLQHGADINAQDKEGTTALMHAAQNNHARCFQLLLKEGADLDTVNERGSTVFSFAARGEGYVLDLLLKDDRFLCDGVLKSEHKAGLLKAMIQTDPFDFIFSMKSRSLLLEYSIFDWDWCVQSAVDHFQTFITPAIRSSICPGTMIYKGSEISVLPLAFSHSQSQYLAPSIKFLLAHRYFYPKDYAFLSTNMSFRDDSSYEMSKILDRLTLHPLSLQTWSFLTVSKSVSQAGPSTGRTVRVDALPLPDRMKRALKFQTNITELCPYEWENITIDQAFDSLNFLNEISWEEDLNCQPSGMCLECGTDYYEYKAHQEC